MALTEAQQHDIVRTLGWPGNVIRVGSLDYNKQIVDRLVNISSESEGDAVALLTRIAKLDTQLDAALVRASTKEIDGVVLNPDEMKMLRGERRRVCRELSELLDIPYVSKIGRAMIGVSN
jgi:hypothetical protein